MYLADTLSRAYFVHVTSSPTYPQSNGKVEAAVNSAKNVIRRSRKARTDPYLAFLEYRNTPSQGLGTSPVQRLMSRRIRAQPPIIPQLLTPVVQPGTYQQLLTNKERQVRAYNRGSTDMGALWNGDTVRLVPPGNSNKEAVKAKAERCVGTRSFEVVTEDGARYRRNRRHLRRTKEAYRSPKSGLVAEEDTEQPEQQSLSLPERAQTGHELSAPCNSQTYPVVKRMRPMRLRWHLGNRSHVVSLLRLLCKAQPRDQAELLKGQLIWRIMSLGCNHRWNFLRFHKLWTVELFALFVTFFPLLFVFCLWFIRIFIRERMWQ